MRDTRKSAVVQAGLRASFGRVFVFLAVVVQTIPNVASAAKATRFWNLTANTIVGLQLAPAGTQAFGADQAKNDKDGSVDHDERLKITGVSTGSYDARLTDSAGRKCLVKDIGVKEGEVFSIEEAQLKDCTK